jgi:hypothetical protein
MEADWTRLQPPDQTTPAHPKVAPPSRHNNRQSCTRTQRLTSFVPVWLIGGCNPGSGFTLREQGRRWGFDCQSMNSALDICQVATYTQ